MSEMTDDSVRRVCVGRISFPTSGAVPPPFSIMLSPGDTLEVWRDSKGEATFRYVNYIDTAPKPVMELRAAPIDEPKEPANG